MIRKSLGVFVVCASLALPFRCGSRGRYCSAIKLSAAAIVDKNVAARAGCRRGGRCKRVTRGKLGAGGIGGLLFQYQSRAHMPAPRRLLRGRPRRFNCRL